MSEPFGLSTLGQISMNAKDLPRATAFYKDVLGIPFLFGFPGMSFFDMDGVRLMVATPEKEEFDRRGSILYFKVPDIHVAHRELVARGVEFGEAPRMIADMGRYELWMGSFKDTEENDLALMSEVPKG